MGDFLDESKAACTARKPIPLSFAEILDELGVSCQFWLNSSYQNKIFELQRKIFAPRNIQPTFDELQNLIMTVDTCTPPFNIPQGTCALPPHVTAIPPFRLGSQRIADSQGNVIGGWNNRAERDAWVLAHAQCHSPPLYCDLLPYPPRFVSRADYDLYVRTNPGCSPPLLASEESGSGRTHTPTGDLGWVMGQPRATASEFPEWAKGFLVAAGIGGVLWMLQGKSQTIR